MMTGYERYYQIARCFRDEDLRADRQPEFTQLDLEMAFVEEDDVLGVIEGLLARVFEEAGFEAPPPPWPRMGYDEAMPRFGSDKPGHCASGWRSPTSARPSRAREFRVFSGVLEGGGVVRGLNAGAREVPRSELDAADRGRQALRRRRARVGVRAGGRHLALAGRQVPRPTTSAPRSSGALSAQPGDLLLIVADTARTSRRPRSASCGWSSRAATT